MFNFSKSRDFPRDDVIWTNHGFFKITYFQKSRLFFKITVFSHLVRKSRLLRTLWENHGFFTPCEKITVFSHLVRKSRLFHTFTEFRAFFKTSVFLKKIPRSKSILEIPVWQYVKKSRFSVQDLGFRLWNMTQTHNRMVIDQFFNTFFQKPVQNKRLFASV